MEKYVFSVLCSLIFLQGNFYLRKFIHLSQEIIKKIYVKEKESFFFLN